jgi:protein-S-isoprenylcysteine O-methyltransferase Ste14
MFYLLQLLILLNLVSFFRFALFLFNKNVNLSSLPLIFSQTFSILIWINAAQVVLNNKISPFNIKIGIAVHILTLILFWTHIRKTGRTSIETDEDLNLSIPNFGLFKFIRHPIFSIYLTVYFCIFWLFDDGIGIILCLFLSLIYMRIGRQRDLQMLNSELSEDYEQYMGKTGILTPNPLYFFR